MFPPVPEKPELEIEDWKLKIYGGRFAPSFLTNPPMLDLYIHY
jgi:hypothetical protein